MLKDLFDYFEEADESVYVSDVETNEIIFMNRRLRENLGYTGTEQYIGKKCHTVLQGNDSPCKFCNNAQLEEGKFTIWANENPVMNQRFLIKDTVMVRDGRKYRVEVATKINRSGMEKSASYFTRREAILNECLQLFFSNPEPDESLDGLLEHLGEAFHGDRAYIFEVDENDLVSNTYEWCAPGIRPQIDILQGLPLSDIDYWVQIFAKDEAVEIRNLEDICREHPAAYSLLKPQQIRTLVAGGIQEKGVLKGLVGIDNPDLESVPVLAQVLKELGKYMIPQLKRRDLYQRFNKMSYQDLLTGAYNNNAMTEHTKRIDPCESFAAVYCDINGLKEINDTRGHSAGNALIQQCYQILKKALCTEWIYRVGGDEFVALYYNVPEEQVKKDIADLKVAVMQGTCQISIGHVWSDQQPIDIEQVLNQADALMYQEKEQYYANVVRPMDHRPQNLQDFSRDQTINGYHLKLRRFLADTYCDIPFFLTQLSNDNSTSYFFFGDMQKNLFFLSENMRKKFGFEDNIIPDFFNRWAERILDPLLLQKFWNDINGVLEKKQDYHDMRYQIADAQGQITWIRCFGRVKWNEEGTKPLFFAGRMSQQEEGFVVDVLTNFPTEPVLAKHLQKIRETNQHCQAIGFSFHSVTQINNNHGRSYGDNLIRNIARELSNRMSDRLTFYRLSGMRCLALTARQTPEEIQEIIAQIKEIIDEGYEAQGVALQYTCSFALMRYPQEGVSPQDFIENMILLIKVAHQAPAQPYIDNSIANIQKMQKISNMESHLIENIINGMENFRIVVQPLVSIEDQRPCGAETLLRWRFHGEEISPADFIPIIENAHMINQVGRWVFEQAVHSCVRMLTYVPQFYLTVNISLQQLEDEGFVEFIRQTLQKYDLGGEHMVLELTESCMDDQPEKLERFVKGCNDLGIRIALDDFGSGYSSMRVLLRYPSSIIKLDRSLLLEMSDSYEKNGFITSLVYACHQFGKQVCMEGVETDFQYELVKEAGCDLIQGFYYYRPMELDQAYQLAAQLYEEGET